MTEDNLSESQQNVLRFALAMASAQGTITDRDPNVSVKMFVDGQPEEQRRAVETGPSESEPVTNGGTEIEYAYHLLFTRIVFITPPPNPSIFANVRDNFTWRLKLRVKGHTDTRVVDIPIKSDQLDYPLFESFDITRNYFVNQNKGYPATPDRAGIDFDRNQEETPIVHTNDKFSYEVYYKYIRTVVSHPTVEDDGPVRSAEAPTMVNLVANTRTMELHKTDCEYANRISAKNKRVIPCEEAEVFLYTGYDGCAYCFDEVHYK